MSVPTNLAPIVAAAGAARRELARSASAAMDEWAGKTRADFDRNHLEQIADDASALEKELGKVAQLCHEAMKAIELRD